MAATSYSANLKKPPKSKSKTPPPPHPLLTLDTPRVQPGVTDLIACTVLFRWGEAGGKEILWRWHLGHGDIRVWPSISPGAQTITSDLNGPDLGLQSIWKSQDSSGTFRVFEGKRPHAPHSPLRRWANRPPIAVKSGRLHQSGSFVLKRIALGEGEEWADRGDSRAFWFIVSQNSY